MNKIVIFGAGSLAEMVCFYLERKTPNCVAGFIVDPEHLLQDSLMNLPVVSSENMGSIFPSASFDMIVAIGYSNMRARALVINRMRDTGYTFKNLIPESGCDGSINGTNNIIMPGSVVEPFATIGNDNIIWSGAHICHNANIQNNNFFATGSIIGGYTKIDNGCFFGFGSIVIENIKVSEETLVAAGGVVTEDTQAHSQYMGLPAKISDNHKGTGIIF